MQEAARVRSKEFVIAHGLRFAEGLPFIESIEELDPPSAEDVARRTLVLTHMIGVGYDADRQLLIASLRDLDLWSAVSDNERLLLTQGELTEQQRIDATWWVECVQVLAWGLGLVGLDHFSQCDDDLASHFRAPGDREALLLVEEASLRPFDEIYEECDLLYCLHWAAVEARLFSGDVPVLDEGVVRERHRAINWLAGVESNWDEVPTDT